MPYKSGVLSDVATQIKRKSDGDDYPIMMISSTEGFIYQAERYSKDNAGTSKAKYTLLYYGELSYNHGNSKTKKYGSVFTLNKQVALIPFVYHSFKIQNQNPFYFGRYLNLPMHDKYLVKVISSGARMDGLLNISFEDFFKMPIKYPTIEEQDYIECFLKHIDEKILIIQKKTNTLKKYKRGLQKTLLNLGETTDYYRLKDIVKFEPKSNISAGDSVNDAKYVLFKSGQKNGLYDTYTNDGIYIIANDGGEASFKLTNGKFAYTDHCICFKCKTNEETIVLGNFLEYNAPKITFIGFTGTGLKNIDRQYLGMLKVPNLDYKKIAQTFVSISRAIEINNEQLDKLSHVKQYLLNSLFI